jgi:hypothetical protein
MKNTLLATLGLGLVLCGCDKEAPTLDAGRSVDGPARSNLSIDAAKAKIVSALAADGRTSQSYPGGMPVPVWHYYKGAAEITGPAVASDNDWYFVGNLSPAQRDLSKAWTDLGGKAYHLRSGDIK